MRQSLFNKSLFGAQLNMSHPFSRGLVGYWLMNDQGYRVHDVSPYANHGSLVGFTSPTYSLGQRSSQGIKFDGLDDCVDAGTKLSLNVGNGINQFTLSLWIYTNNIGAGIRVLLGKVRLSTQSWGIYQSTNLIRIQSRGALGGVDFSGGAILAGTWYHIVMTKDSVNINIYVNGVFRGSGAYNLTDPINTVADIFYIGRPVILGQYYFDGIIHNACVWNRALSALEVQQLHSQPYSMFEEVKT